MGYPLIESTSIATPRDVLRVGCNVYADDDGLANGGVATTAEEAAAIVSDTEEGAEALTIGLGLVGIRPSFELRLRETADRHTSDRA